MISFARAREASAVADGIPRESVTSVEGGEAKPEVFHGLDPDMLGLEWETVGLVLGGLAGWNGVRSFRSFRSVVVGVLLVSECALELESKCGVDDLFMRPLRSIHDAGHLLQLQQ